MVVRFSLFINLFRKKVLFGMILGISTGCCYDLGLTRIDAMRFLKQFDIDAIELMFAFPKDLFDFKLSREDIAFLRSKKYVSLHAPFKEVEYENNAKAKELLSALNSLALKVNARNVVFHANCIKDFSILGQSDFTPLIENLNFRADAERLYSVKQLQDFLSAHENFGFCLDFGHALKESICPKEFLVLGNRLKQVHLHFLREKKGEIKPHGAPSKTEKRFLQQAEPFLSLNIPIIIEWDFLPSEQHLIAKEIELLHTVARGKQK